ncbi:hypothetical protein BDV37DRAFT_26957 [Aspergillus pseudonomiae]|uniref:Uncharacterized protein n=1 Tax=Aspergillus pseudonomiae TaxID=1506151 RepID=A0A5N7CWN3_9EURO|nr:uncharacterized protein BDV37DRAFT_26957 [Aspergillus pseudonomiae]KAE8398581.1 hypothetical protein BDV37DRAFT_26957 [Aspergillus pseudonomiae]
MERTSPGRISHITPNPHRSFPWEWIINNRIMSNTRGKDSDCPTPDRSSPAIGAAPATEPSSRYDRSSAAATLVNRQGSCIHTANTPAITDTVTGGPPDLPHRNFLPILE